ncbi:hypothetical protein [Candidatus Poriferisodalis sp.]|uniref:hypothetical protein n=1 Tax=Candidatus Poriferisodalis sp. TaxID=3101277 RepID=UPI003B0287D0
MALDSDRIHALHAAKLRALSRAVLDVELADVAGTDDGALAVAEGPNSSVVCLAQERPERALGGALALALRSSREAVHVFADECSDVLARRAMCFLAPPIIWQIDGASATVAAPALRPVEPAPPRVPELVAVLSAAGVDVAVEHGVITGEVEGLEVARIVADAALDAESQESSDEGAESDEPPAVSREQGSAWKIEVGVGAHDREAFSMLHVHEPTPEAVARVAGVVRAHRSPGASPHPLNRLASARWLRALLLRQPELVGARHLGPASPPVPRGGPKDPSPAVAYGVRADGSRVVVVASVGIDLNLVPFGADARAFLDPDADLVLALPERDAHDVISAMAALLERSAEIVPIDNGWRTGAPGSRAAERS